MTPPPTPRTAAGRDFLALAERDPSIMDIEGFRDRILAIEAEAASAETAAWLSEGYHRSEVASPSAGLRAALEQGESLDRDHGFTLMFNPRTRLYEAWVWDWDAPPGEIWSKQDADPTEAVRAALRQQEEGQ